MQGIYQIHYHGKCAYIGSALDIQRRFRQHRDTLKRNTHRNFILQRIWGVHQSEMEFDVVELVDDASSLQEREQFYIDTMKPIANIAKANGSHPHTEEARAKMRGRVVSSETRSKLSLALMGKESPMKGIKTGRVPKTAFKTGGVPWNKKYTEEEHKEKRREWNRINGKKYRERHGERLKEYKRMKAREYRARKKELLHAASE